MKKSRAFLVSILTAMFAVCLGIAVAACSGSSEDRVKNSAVYNVGEEGVYYFDSSSGAEYLMTLQSGVYMISMNGGSGYSGSYTYETEEGRIVFTTDGGEEFYAAFSDGAMSLAIEDTAYTFLKKTDFLVTFADGAETVSTQYVTYGRAATAPSAEKDGYLFLGWYEDEAFTKPYGFDTAITANTTLYAYFVEIDPSAENYRVTFVSGGEIIAISETVNGMIYEFPEVGGLLGWWVCATGDADLPTYRYDGEVLKESTTLVAVADEGRRLGASVYDDRIELLTATPSGRVTVLCGGEEVGAFSLDGKTSYSFDFTALPSGTYTVEVSSTGYETETLVFVNKGLSRVSNFSVYGNVLVYNAVENAETYYVLVKCGNPNHEHYYEYNGSTLTYDFSSCEMGPDGIRFTVCACAYGYETSVSETFVYALVLGTPEVSVDEKTDTALWTKTENAAGYEVYVNGEYAATVTGTEYSLKGFDAGTQISVSVKATAPGYWSEISEPYEYTKETLRAPGITSVSGYEITWEKVEGAVKYELNINGYLITLSALDGESEPPTTYDLTETDMEHISDENTNALSVTAVAEDPAKNSQSGDIAYVTHMAMNPVLTYSDGEIFWLYALGVETYTVEYEGLTWEVEGANSTAVTFSHSGENVVNVYFTVGGEKSAQATISVTTYAVILVPGDYGDEVTETLYVASGDRLVLPELTTTVSGTNFSGWYTLPDPELSRDSEGYSGDGYEVTSGTVFDGNGSMVLYALWLAEKVGVRLDAGSFGELENGAFADTQISYGSSSFSLPVPEATDGAYAFWGWYSGEDGTGTRYTDETGKAVTTFETLGETTVYARWIQLFVFSATTYNGADVVSVTKGSDISMVSEVIVPAYYEIGGVEYPVAVVDSGAFNSCAGLVTINLPDTVQYISIVNNGYTKGNGSFAESAGIKNVNVYPTGDGPDTMKVVAYYSSDGVLYRNNNITGQTELVYYPQGRTDKTFEIADSVSNIYEYEYDENLNEVPVVRDVTSVATQVFTGKTVTEVIIPCTVTNIEMQAFYNASVEKVTFAGDPGDPLTVTAYAFQGCTSLTEVTLPARLSSFNVNSFSGCTALANINVSGEGGNFSSIDGILCSADKTEITYCPPARSGDYTVPDGVTSIAAGAFSAVTDITGVTIAATVEKIGESAFENCRKLSSLTFEGDANSNGLYIESYAFYGCSSLTSVTLPVNLMGLAAYSFGNCANLFTVTYDSLEYATTESLSGLEAYAFSSSSSAVNSYVTTLNLGANVPEIDFVMIFGGPSLATVNIAEGGKAAYKSVTYDGKYDVVYNADMTTIHYFPFAWEGAYEVPGSVTVIQSNIFNGRTGLTELTIPASVTTISERAFENCTGLKKVTFSALEVSEEDDDPAQEQDLVIEAYAFSGCSSLSEIELPARLVSIGNYAFRSCTSLTTLELPRGLTSLGTGVFDSCKSFEEITVADGNEYFSAEDGVLYELTGGVATTLKWCPIYNKNTSITVPNTVTKIDGSAFANNETVEEITFTDGVSSSFAIDSGVFDSCKALKKITLPSGMTSIAKSAFYQCYSIEEMVIPDTVTTINQSAFQNCTSLETVTFAGNRTSSTKLTFTAGTQASSKGSAGAFAGCTALKEINLPDYTTVNAYTFYNCSALEKVTVGATSSTSLTIANYAYYGTSSLSEFILPSGTNVTSVGEGAFWYSGIPTLDLSHATNISSNAFREAGLTEISLSSSITSSKLDISAFYYMPELTKIEIADGNSSYCAIDGVMYEATRSGSSGNYEYTPTKLLVYPEKNLVTEITVPSTVTSIDNIAFYYSNIEVLTFESEYDSEGNPKSNFTFSISRPFDGCYQLQKVVLPAGLTSVPSSMFQSQTSLQEIVIPYTVTNIGNDVFDGCSGLTTVTFEKAPEGVTEANLTFSNGQNDYDPDESDYWYYGTFRNCTSLKEITIPDRCTSLGTYMFWGCTSLESITLGSGVTAIPNYMCLNCTSLKHVYFGENSSVTSIGQYAFQYCGKMEIELPSSLTTINQYAFQYSDIVSVTFGDGVTSISNYAFQYCASLESVTITGIMTSVGSNAFQGCSSLKTLTIEGGEESLTIGGSAFINCTSLTSVVIPARVTSIGASAFSGCSKLVSVTFEQNSTIKAINASAFANTMLTSFTFPESTAGSIELGGTLFSGCYHLTEVVLSSSITSIGTALSSCYTINSITIAEGNTAYVLDDTQPILYNAEKTEMVVIFGELSGTFVIPDTITTITASAFSKQSTFTELVIPGSVTSIGANAFEYCTSLKNVTIEAGSSLTIGNQAFQYCYALETFTVGSGHSYTLGQYAFRGCTSLKEMDLSDVDISAATPLSTYIFYDCSSLTSVILPEGLTSLPNYMFQKCTSLTYVYLPSTLTTLGQYAFNECTSLKEITLPDGATSLGGYMFMNCYSLEKVVLPSTVTSISVQAFQNCGSLYVITYNGDTGYRADMDYSGVGYCAFSDALQSIGNYAFDGCGFISFNIPYITGSFGTYMLRGNASLKYVTIADGVTSLAQYTFQNCTSLEYIDLNDVTTFSGMYVFSGCTALKSIDISNITSMSTYTFQGCTSLESVVWNPAVTTVPTYMFDGCSSLTTLEGADGVTEVGNYAFRGCSSLVNFGQFASLTVVGAYSFQGCGFEWLDLSGIGTFNTVKVSSVNYSSAFADCENLMSVTLPTSSSLATLPYYLFSGCTSLASVYLPGNITTLQDGVFQNCTSLVYVDLGSLTTLGSYTFQGCTSLVYVDFSPYMTSIPSYTFSGCASLQELDIPLSITSWGSYAFEGCVLFETITIPATVTSVGSGCFKDCTALKEVRWLSTCTSINSYVFYECTALESVSFSNYATSIGDYAFYDCESLTEVNIPSTMQKIQGNYSFAGTTSLKSLTLPDSMTYLNYTGTFMGSGIESLNIPKSLTNLNSYTFEGANCVKYYDVDPDNTKYMTGPSGEIITISDNKLFAWPGGYEGVAYVQDVTQIEQYAFYGADKITGVVIGEGVTYVSTYAFQNCTALESVVFPSSLTQISNYVFANTGLKELVIPATLTSIGSYAFAGTPLESVEIQGTGTGSNMFDGCTNLTDVKFTGAVTSLGSYMFNGCTALTGIEIPSTVTTINQYAFAGSGIKEITIPASVATIGNYAFQNASLTKVVFEGVPTSWGTYMFDGCEDLTDVTFAEGTTSFGSYMFNGCVSLKEIELPSTVTSLPTYMFAGCTSLESIIIPDGVTTISEGVFQNCSSLESVTMGEGVTTISKNAFEGCTSIRDLYIPVEVHSVGASAFAGWTADQTIHTALTPYYIYVWWTSGWDTDCGANMDFGYSEADPD